MIKAAYLFNLLILIPVCWSLFFGNNKNGLSVFDSLFPEEKGLSYLVGSLWFGILICSVGGLLYPYKFWAILLLQILYKSTYLISYIFPTYLKGQPIPKGVTAFFVMIVITYPFVLYLNRGSLWS